MSGDERRPNGSVIDGEDLGALSQLSQTHTDNRNADEQEEEDSPFGGPRPIVPYSSLIIFSPTNPCVHALLHTSNCFFQRIRVVVHSIVSTKYFEMVVMGVICLSSMSLAAEDPIDESSDRNRYLKYMDYCFTLVFTIELVLKVCSATDLE